MPDFLHPPRRTHHSLFLHRITGRTQYVRSLSIPFQGLCDRAVGQLLSLLGSPYLVPGGGCLESAIAWKLRQNLVSISCMHMNQSSSFFMVCSNHSAIVSGGFIPSPFITFIFKSDISFSSSPSLVAGKMSQYNVLLYCDIFPATRL